MFATVLTALRQRGITDGLTYHIPDGMSLAKGALVRIPFRKQKALGIVIEVQESAPEGVTGMRDIESVLHSSLFTGTHIELIRWIAEYYCCSLQQAIRVFLPGKEWSRIIPKEVLCIRVDECPAQRLSEKQQLCVDAIRGKSWVPVQNLRGELGINREFLKRLEAKGCLSMQMMLPREECRTGSVLLEDESHLSEDQQNAFQSILRSKVPSLLFGVTGSGKTEIYASLVRDALSAGKSALILVPEILLTEHIVERFRRLVDAPSLVVIHSRLGTAERWDILRRIIAGSVRLVIGSRSALFAPLKKLGVVIIDEEHEWTYKNEQMPRYHAVRVAEKLCSLLGARLVLGSATPSVDSWYAAKRGVYALVELPERFRGTPLPQVRIIDLASFPGGGTYPLTPPLIEAIRERIERHEQSVLFLNRRGFASGLLCTKCRVRFVDEESHLPFTVHFRGRESYLLSHHTGQTLPFPTQCPSCGSSDLHMVGAGTQKVERIIETLFPSARVLRADADTLRSPEHIRLLLGKMQSGEADILLGTQSVVKGLDLPGVTLAAVLLADIGLSIPHFRAGERVFQLLTQLAGRSGRRQPGEVIIQTYRPDAPEVTLAACHHVREYLDRELRQRETMHYPPSAEMVRCIYTGHDAEKMSSIDANVLRKLGGVIVSRTPSLFRGRGVWYVFVRGANAHSLVRNTPLNGSIDIDPVECV